LAIAQSAWGKKAENIQILDIRKISDISDYFVICSANSDRGVKTIADNIERYLKDSKEPIIGLEGYSKGKWVLIDSVDVVANIFYEPVREFYDIEGLWIEAPRIDIDFDLGVDDKKADTK